MGYYEEYCTECGVKIPCGEEETCETCGEVVCITCKIEHEEECKDDEFGF
jgi:hypothetical protein